MKKREIFAEIIEIVVSETDVPCEEILSKSKQAEVVDARYMLIMALLDFGFYPSEVAQMVGLTSRSINYTISNFDTRMSYAKYKRNTYDRIRKRVGNIAFAG